MKVNTNKFGESVIQELYANYAKMDFVTFKAWCIKAIQENLVSSNGKKAGFVSDFQRYTNKDRLVKSMTSIFLSGEGLKVA